MKLKVRLVVAAVTAVSLILMFRYLRRVDLKKERNVLEAPKKNFPADSRIEPNLRESFVDSELKRLRIEMGSSALSSSKWPWEIAARWVNKRHLYPEHHPELAQIMRAMAKAKVVQADALPKGTQLKILLVLEGNQKVVFKQKRYVRDFVVEGKPYDGFDRHNGEIASFHMDRVFNFRRTPITMGRVLNLREEVLPVATERLKNTFSEIGGNLCYYGVCYYCKESEKACANGDIMEGSITLWLPEEYSHFEKLRHPYQRTYANGRKAKWETDENYCNMVVKHKPPYDRGTRLLDVTDAAVFDYLIGNADRHHYEVFKDKGNDAMLIMMDNAKSFGNPYWHEPSILAPIRQCCILRNSTWNKLHQFENGVLRKLLEAAMESDPISPVLHHSHLKALTERIPHILTAIQHCIDANGRKNVLLNEWKGVNAGT